MRGRVPGPGFPHVLGVCEEAPRLHEHEGAVSELRIRPGTGTLQDPLREFFPGPGRRKGGSDWSRQAVVEKSLFRISHPPVK